MTTAVLVLQGCAAIGPGFDSTTAALPPPVPAADEGTPPEGALREIDPELVSRMRARQPTMVSEDVRALLGTPEKDGAVYDAASPLTYMKAAKAPLLTIQGENDIRVPRGQAQEVHDLLKAKGNVVETIFYPGEGHGFQKRENQLDSLRRTIGWFDKYLKGE